MFKNVFLILSICILFLGYKQSRKNNGILEHINNEETIVINANANSGTNDYLENYLALNGIDLKDIKRLDLMAIREEDKIYEIKLYDDYYNDNILLIIGGNNIIDILSDFNLENLEELRISGRIISFSSIGDLRSLKKLYLEHLWQINDISAISGLENLEYLMIIECKKLENFSPIFDLIELKYLYWENFGNENEPDLTHIGNLNKLEYFYLSPITQSNLNSLAGLEQLKELELWRSNIEDVSPLLKLPNLEKIHFGTDWVDIMPLLASNSIKYIQINNKSYDDFYHFLENQKKLFEANGISVRSFWESRE
ncbi:MAG: hypothetical protein LBI06_00995 [Treponema sp.]|jgi:hypothetical protein|nr:hypothetical protein [Treponema sp.]